MEDKTNAYLSQPTKVSPDAQLSHSPSFWRQNCVCMMFTLDSCPVSPVLRETQSRLVRTPSTPQLPLYHRLGNTSNKYPHWYRRRRYRRKSYARLRRRRERYQTHQSSFLTQHRAPRPPRDFQTFWPHQFGTFRWWPASSPNDTIFGNGKHLQTLTIHRVQTLLLLFGLFIFVAIIPARAYFSSPCVPHHPPFGVVIALEIFHDWRSDGDGIERVWFSHRAVILIHLLQPLTKKMPLLWFFVFDWFCCCCCCCCYILLERTATVAREEQKAIFHRYEYEYYLERARVKWMRIDDAHLREVGAVGVSMKKKRKRTRRKTMIGDRRRKKELLHRPLFFSEGEIFGKLSKNLREFCVFFGGVSNVEVQKKIIEVQNNARPPCRWCRKFVWIFHSYERHITPSLHHIIKRTRWTPCPPWVAEQQRSLEDDLVWDGDAVVSEIFERFNHRHVFLFFFPRGCIYLRLM